jgi:hypothetical protein
VAGNFCTVQKPPPPAPVLPPIIVLSLSPQLGGRNISGPLLFGRMT